MMFCDYEQKVSNVLVSSGKDPIYFCSTSNRMQISLLGLPVILKILHVDWDCRYVWKAFLWLSSIRPNLERNLESFFKFDFYIIFAKFTSDISHDIWTEFTWYGNPIPEVCKCDQMLALLISNLNLLPRRPWQGGRGCDNVYIGI